MPITNYLPSSRLIQPGVCTSSTRPASPFEGQVIYETNTRQTLVWQGTAWVMLTDADTPPGLQLVKAQTVGSGVASVTVTDAFSAEWDNYRVLYIGGTQSADSNIDLQLAGSSSGYNSVLLYTSSTSSSPQAASVNSGNSWNWVGGAASGQSSHMEVDLLGPFLSSYTKMRLGAYQNSNFYGTCNGEHRVASSYTGITLYAASGTFTGGTIRVYGYRNS